MIYKIALIFTLFEKKFQKFFKNLLLSLKAVYSDLSLNSVGANGSIKRELLISC